MAFKRGGQPGWHPRGQQTEENPRGKALQFIVSFMVSHSSQTQSRLLNSQWRGTVHHFFIIYVF